MKRNPPTKAQGLEMARTLKMLLQRHGFPVRDVLLFGSVARGSPHPWSDIDIAVVHDPFGTSRAEELRAMCRAEEGTELQNIEVLYFHPDDLGDKYSTIAQEVKRHGISV
jgi:predicted nucleotidyltransferase